MNKEKILKFNISTINQENLLDKIFSDYTNNIKNFIVNINPEIIINNYKNENFIKIFNQQKYQIPDGIGIVWASKKLKGNIKNRITGIDLMQKICENSTNYKAKIFLYGSNINIAEKAKIELEKKYPGILIVGTCNGFVDEQIAIESIKKSNADILFVGLGAPKQEKFIINNMNNLDNIKLFMPVGGSFDVISKTIKRAPNWIIKLNLEWLYRLFKQPVRLFRQIKLFKFIYLIYREKFRRNSDGKN